MFSCALIMTACPHNEDLVYLGRLIIAYADHPVTDQSNKDMYRIKTADMLIGPHRSKI